MPNTICTGITVEENYVCGTIKLTLMTIISWVGRVCTHSVQLVARWVLHASPKVHILAMRACSILCSTYVLIYM